MNKLRIESWSNDDHRSGWKYAMSGLDQIHNEHGILFNGFLEESFCWPTDCSRRNNLPYTEPWVGVLHCPPNMPQWFQYEQSPQSILNSENWRLSIESCKGLFTLSKYLKNWLLDNVDVPVSSLVHPTGEPADKFSTSAFAYSKSVIAIGYWLRRFHNFYRLKTNMNKIHIVTEWASKMMPIELEQHNICLSQKELQSVCQINFVNKSIYDSLLSRSIVFLDLYDCSASNTIIECIIRHTPILVNKLEPVVEYLGDDYPFYYSTLDDAERLLSSTSAILNAHDYLREMPKEVFTKDYFCDSLVKSEVYKKL